MNRSFPIRITIIFLLSSLFLQVGYTSNANIDEDIGAVTRITWDSKGQYLSDKFSLEQEILFTELQGKAGGVVDYHRFHMFFCWKTLDTSQSLKGSRNACGFVGLAPITNGNKITGASFDLSLWDAIEGDSNACEKRSPMAKVGDVQTYYVTCGTGVRISANTTYILKVQATKRPAGKAEYWWSATLTNKSTGENVTVGQIKNHSIDTETQLEDLQNVYFYRGTRSECDSIPIGDMLVSSIRNSADRPSKFSYSYNEKCIRAVVYPDSQKVNYMQIRFGGSNPGARDPNYKELASPTPTPSSSISSSPSPSITNKPEVDQKLKPYAPTFSEVNFVGNKLNININLGAANPSRPEKVYLVAPLLGITAANPMLGTIFGNSAAWSISLEKVLAGTLIPLEIIGERDGVFSDSLSGSYQAPAVLNPIKSVQIPDQPKKFKSRIVGSSALITVETTLRPGAIASQAFLFGKSLGIPKSQAIEGDLVGEKVILEVPLKTSMSGKKFPVTIFFSNEKGDSKPLNATLAIPAAPKFVAPPTLLPTKEVKATICVRSTQTRAFEGTACPPGWIKK